MRFLHTADWHLGRVLHGQPLLPDQAQVLEQLVDLVRQGGLDALLLCGDVYDRSVPPADAVALLDDVISEIVLGCRVPVIMIAGNHDGPERLAFGSRVLHQEGLHVTGPLPEESSPLRLADDHGPVSFHSIPFAVPSVVRHVLQEEDVHTHQQAMARLAERERRAPQRAARSVLLAHAFVSGGESSDSERPLTVGGAEQVAPECFAGFDYVALGHLHRPQTPVPERVRYSGSLMKYSFSEVAHTKSVDLVEMDARGVCSIEPIRLKPPRDLRLIAGTFEGIVSCFDPDAPGRQDYIQVRLAERLPPLDAMARLRELYPNVLSIERDFVPADSTGPVLREDHRKLSDLDLFRRFYEDVSGEPLSSVQEEAFLQALRELGPESSAAG